MRSSPDLLTLKAAADSAYGHARRLVYDRLPGDAPAATDLDEAQLGALVALAQAEQALQEYRERSSSAPSLVR